MRKNLLTSKSKSFFCTGLRIDRVLLFRMECAGLLDTCVGKECFWRRSCDNLIFLRFWTKNLKRKTLPKVFMGNVIGKRSQVYLSRNIKIYINNKSMLTIRNGETVVSRKVCDPCSTPSAHGPSLTIGAGSFPNASFDEIAIWSMSLEKDRFVNIYNTYRGI